MVTLIDFHVKLKIQARYLNLGPIIYVCVFPELKITTFSFSCLSVRQHGTSWLPLDRFTWNLMVFRKCVNKIRVYLKFDKKTDTLSECLCTFIISRWTLLGIRNVQTFFRKACFKKMKRRILMEPERSLITVQYSACLCVMDNRKTLQIHIHNI